MESPDISNLYATQGRDIVCNGIGEYGDVRFFSLA